MSLKAATDLLSCFGRIISGMAGLCLPGLGSPDYIRLAVVNVGS
jgi:hypothetical protein